MRILILIALTLPLAACAVDSPPTEDGLGPHVTVTGQSRIEVVPDELRVQVTVTHTDDSVIAATASVGERTLAALDAVRAAGVADEDIRALAVRVQPQYDWKEGERVLRGHVASRPIEIRLRDLDAWPGLLEALIGAGVDRVDSVNAEVSDRDAVAREALRAAVLDARARADLIAEAAGTRVRAVYSIDETGREWAQPMPRQEMAMRASADQAAAYEPGTITITSNVQAVYLLRGG